MLLVLPEVEHRRVLGELHVLVVQGVGHHYRLVRHESRFVQRVEHHHVPVGLVPRYPLVIVHLIGPHLVVRVVDVDVVAEMYDLVVGVIPSGQGFHEAVVPPHIGPVAEVGLVLVREEIQLLRSEEYGVGEHLDIALEGECLAG